MSFFHIWLLKFVMKIITVAVQSLIGPEGNQFDII